MPPAVTRETLNADKRLRLTLAGDVPLRKSRQNPSRHVRQQGRQRSIDHRFVHLDACARTRRHSESPFTFAA